jgi:hypothetical protein
VYIDCTIFGERSRIWQAVSNVYPIPGKLTVVVDKSLRITELPER